MLQSRPLVSAVVTASLSKQHLKANAITLQFIIGFATPTDSELYLNFCPNRNKKPLPNFMLVGGIPKILLAPNKS